jgi:hypothetical protein
MSLLEPSKNSFTPQSPKTSSGKRPVSERKIQANRRNALRSTGPKTARGKQIVGRNAIKHGLLAREVVITAGDGEESREQFHALVERLWKDYEPVGVIEESLVQMIATCLWRKARVIRAENGEIRRRLDTTRMDSILRDLDRSNLALLVTEMNLGRDIAENGDDGRFSTEDQWSAVQGLQRDMRGHRKGLEYLSELLLCGKSEIASNGHMSGHTQRRIFWAFSSWDFMFALTCLFDGSPEAKAEAKPFEKNEDQRAEKKHSDVMTFIDSRISMLDALAGCVSEREEVRADAEKRSFSLPPKDATDKLLRYESHLDRQLYRAMDQLERLQRQRKGESVPPPLNINLGRRN